jgi:cytochrome c-type biogenesis protein CcmF
MTRSGVFNSVHSFTQSAIGPTILVFLAAALILSVVLLTLRVDTLAPEGRLESGPSRDVVFLVQNLLFVLFTFTVLLGTVFPLVVEAARGVQMSVGRPYFDRMSVPIGVCLLFVMGIGPALPWGRATGQQLRSALLPPLLTAAALAVLGFALHVRNGWTLLALFFGGFTAHVTLSELLLPVRQRMRSHGESFAQALGQARRRGQRRFGAYIVHAGALLAIVAIGVSSTMGTSKEVQLRQGESITLGAYSLIFVNAERVSEPHRKSTLARMDVSKDGRPIGSLYPRMNQYESQREPIGTPAVRTSLTEDLYLSILNVDAGSGTLGLLVLVNPMVGWIWIATAVMALGGLVALTPPWRGARVPATGSVPVGAVSPEVSS